MPLFTLLKRATEPGARKELLADAADPSRQEKALASVGGKVLSHFATAGPFDTIMVVDLPEDFSTLSVSIGCNARGVDTVVMPAFNADAAARALEQSAVVGTSEPFDAGSQAT